MMCEICSKLRISTPKAETYSETSRTSKITLLDKIFNGFWLLPIFTKSFFLDVRLGSDCASENDVNDVKWDM